MNCILETKMDVGQSGNLWNSSASICIKINIALFVIVLVVSKDLFKICYKIVWKFI